MSPKRMLVGHGHHAGCLTFPEDCAQRFAFLSSTDLALNLFTQEDFDVDLALQTRIAGESWLPAIRRTVSDGRERFFTHDLRCSKIVGF